MPVRQCLRLKLTLGCLCTCGSSRSELMFDLLTPPHPEISTLTINVFVPPPHQQPSQHQQQQADAHAAHNEPCVVLLLRQRHLAQVPDGVRLTPLKEARVS